MCRDNERIYLFNQILIYLLPTRAAIYINSSQLELHPVLVATNARSRERGI